MKTSTHLKVARLLMELPVGSMQLVHEGDNVFILVGKHVEYADKKIATFRTVYFDKKVIVLQAPTTLIDDEYKGPPA
jgi:hypothetical protein